MFLSYLSVVFLLGTAIKGGWAEVGRYNTGRYRASQRHLLVISGSCLPLDGTNTRNDHGLQRKMEDLSPNELSMKKAIALVQSMESMLEQNAKEAPAEGGGSNTAAAEQPAASSPAGERHYYGHSVHHK